MKLYVWCGVAAVLLGASLAFASTSEPCAACERLELPAATDPSPARIGLVSFGTAASFLDRLFDTSDFPARWHCGTWTSGHGWLHILSDLAIWAAYMSIPLALFYFVRNRPDVPFTGLFWLFMAFIAACGTGHLIEAGIFWWPAYRLAGLMKLFTALVSWATVIALLPIIPKALALPGLTKLNDQLRQEVSERTEAERVAKAKAEELQRSYEVFLGREERIIELKKQVNDFALLAGRPLPHDLGFTIRSPEAGGAGA